LLLLFVASAALLSFSFMPCSAFKNASSFFLLLSSWFAARAATISCASADSAAAGCSGSGSGSFGCGVGAAALEVRACYSRAAVSGSLFPSA